MISIQHVSVTENGTTVLRDASLDIHPGDAICVLGSEASGKTTFLQLLTREVAPESGIVKIDTAILSQLPREVLRLYRRRLGILPENAPLDPVLTAEQNILTSALVAGMPRQQALRSTADLVKRLDLKNAANKLPKNLSRGEQQLTSFACAIVHGPLILLLDEPFQGLSSESAQTATQLLQNMRKKGATVLIATSDERTASLFPNARRVRLERGKLTEEMDMVRAGSPKQARDAAESALSQLVERTVPDTPAPVMQETERIETKESDGRKKIRITAVGSL